EPRAVEHGRQQVHAVVVGAEEVRRRRPEQLLVQVATVGRVRRDERAEDGGGEEQPQEHQADPFAARFHALRILGSATPYATSTARFTATTMIATTNTQPWITG